MSVRFEHWVNKDRTEKMLIGLVDRDAPEAWETEGLRLCCSFEAEWDEEICEWPKPVCERTIEEELGDV